MNSGVPHPHRLDSAVPFGFADTSPDGRVAWVVHNDRARTLSLIVALLVGCLLLILAAGPFLIFAAGQRNLVPQVVVGMLIGPPIIIYCWVLRRRVLTDCVISRSQPGSPVTFEGRVRGTSVDLAFPAPALTLRIQPIEVSARASGQGLVIWRGYLCRLVGESMMLDLCAYPTADDCQIHLDLACFAGVRRERSDEILACTGDRRLPSRSGGRA